MIQKIANFSYVPTCLIASTLLCTQPAIAADEPLKIIINPEDNITLYLPEIGGGTREIQFSGTNVTHQSQSFDVSADDSLKQQPRLAVADFNFDGNTDFAIHSSYGYGGANMFFELYLYNSKSDSFDRVHDQLGYPILDKDKKRIISSEKSGPIGYVTLYQPVGMNLNEVLTGHYSYGDYMVLSIPQSGSEKATTRVIETDYDDEDWLAQPVARAKIATKRAHFYSKPDGEQKTTYIIEGDEVELLDIDENTGFFHVRYRGVKNTTEGWVTAASLGF